ncbi:hypothetical protein SD37_16815 [Amycolatopsis orientalis]|uniref:GlcNAc-PI de-N-acetylase n=1 Tax=Amycolatopsis orientalis TaxID=31958 RepID=A0A193BY94_AMYOR|nr:PIG-L family deacetylase [Amycolatopsis orientalis]ANN17139.1 hypothetical protein SD37_16815 [Amycolatopsis orientalis]
MRRLVVSPHPDDAVWSCGGILHAWAARGDDVVVCTVFDADGARRQEDADALGLLSVRVRSLRIPEAAERGFYPGPLSRRRGIHAEDRGTVETVAEALLPQLSDADVVLLPRAERTHVDHLIARLAGERVAATLGTELSYYPEFPYSAPLGAPARVHRVDFRPWLRAGLAYRSQVDGMFGGPVRFTRALARHARTPGGHCVWREIPGVS